MRHSIFILMLFLPSSLSGQSMDKGVFDKRAVDKAAAQLLCQCGCAHPLPDCGMHQCHSRGPMTARVEKAVAEGKTEKEILKAFTLDYGVQVLAVPPAEGFNLLVWILPGFAGGFGLLLVGGVVAALRKKKESAPGSAERAGKVDEAMLEKVEKELKRHSE